eukprot:CAMPEP_0198309650 /NCGR_PEP_ID=MMETSP1450-20131203/1967_1 /TAXON_ID=753684 ORGANISM="Madagascaria erythrocladiodes, Strain CCMP3234" /NCGR_SAMPLE_ID=MMETSP1450 /ASSEMBLY_ACC=CAM_ASM_001115 /LENGTH=291 /DNA_ID=CAMNT_0044012419 /DNA_START=179 /DNA_END=1050 /DNA_ORIENTATION=+
MGGHSGQHKNVAPNLTGSGGLRGAAEWSGGHLFHLSHTLEDDQKSQRLPDKGDDSFLEYDELAWDPARISKPCLGDLALAAEALNVFQVREHVEGTFNGVKLCALDGALRAEVSPKGELACGDVDVTGELLGAELVALDCHVDLFDAALAIDASPEAGQAKLGEGLLDLIDSVPERAAGGVVLAELGGCELFGEVGKEDLWVLSADFVEGVAEACGLEEVLLADGVGELRLEEAEALAQEAELVCVDDELDGVAGGGLEEESRVAGESGGGSARCRLGGCGGAEGGWAAAR